MVAIINELEISRALKDIDIIEAMEEGFKQYSKGNTVVPPVGELLFDEPPGETHIKYGYIKNQDLYTIKIASGFPHNSEIGLSASQGMMLLFSQKTGEVKAVILDNGRLTDIRTAAAGALVSKYFSPRQGISLGILGTGIQAKLQLDIHLEHMNVNAVWLWGRNLKKAEEIRDQYKKDVHIRLAESPTELAKNCNLIITTTSSKTPLLCKNDILEGTHITAVGSDTPEKQELDSHILSIANLIVVDSISQSRARGEVFQAMKDNSILDRDVIEVGNALQDSRLQRSDDKQITVADLTGVAVQDIMIAEAVYSHYLKHKEK